MLYLAVWPEELNLCLFRFLTSHIKVAYFLHGPQGKLSSPSCMLAPSHISNAFTWLGWAHMKKEMNGYQSLLKQNLQEIQVNVILISISFAFIFLVSFCLCGVSCGNYILLQGFVFFSPSLIVMYHHQASLVIQW